MYTLCHLADGVHYSPLWLGTPCWFGCANKSYGILNRLQGEIGKNVGSVRGMGNIVMVYMFVMLVAAKFAMQGTTGLQGSSSTDDPGCVHVTL